MALSLAALAGCITDAARAQPLEPDDTFSDDLLDGSRGSEMVVIPAGSFLMGCVSDLGCNDEEMPLSTATIKMRIYRQSG